MGMKNLYNKNVKIQMLREQFLLSKKLYYGYLLNYINEYWRNIYLKFKEKIRKTSLLVMTINNVLNSSIKNKSRISSKDINSSNGPKEMISRGKDINKGNKCIHYDNLMHLIIRMNVKNGSKKTIKKIKKNLAKIKINLYTLAMNSKNKHINDKFKKLKKKHQKNH